MANISFQYGGRDLIEAGKGCVGIRFLQSTCDPLTNNEIPKLLHALKSMDVLNPEAQLGFDYVLDFPLA